MARGICPVQVKVVPKKQRPLTYQEELLARTPEAARAVCRFEAKDEVGVPTHPVVRNGKPVFAADELVDDDKIPWAVLTKKSVSLFDSEDFEDGDFAENPPLSLASVTPASDDKFESMRAQIAALQARVTTLENEKTSAAEAVRSAAQVRWAAEKAVVWWAAEKAAEARVGAEMVAATSLEAAWRKVMEAEAAWHKKIEDAISNRLNDAPKKSKSIFSGMRSRMSFSRGTPRSLEPLCQPLILGHEK
jgi:hypothetical protein